MLQMLLELFYSLYLALCQVSSTQLTLIKSKNILTIYGCMFIIMSLMALPFCSLFSSIIIKDPNFKTTSSVISPIHVFQIKIDLITNNMSIKCHPFMYCKIPQLCFKFYFKFLFTIPGLVPSIINSTDPY